MGRELLRNSTTPAHARFTQMERVLGRGYGLRALRTGRVWRLESSGAGLRGGARSGVETRCFCRVKTLRRRRGRKPGARAVRGRIGIKGRPETT